jgi:hypothetical protein
MYGGWCVTGFYIQLNHLAKKDLGNKVYITSIMIMTLQWVSALKHDRIALFLHRPTIGY